jgi:hypothetical protein
VTLGGQETARARDRGRRRPSGLAIGRALEQAPSPGGTQTIVRTLEPLTVEPQERTVTVTTSER